MTAFQSGRSTTERSEALPGFYNKSTALDNSPFKIKAFEGGLIQHEGVFGFLSGDGAVEVGVLEVEVLESWSVFPRILIKVR